MKIFNESVRNQITDEISESMQSLGVQVCMDNGSVGFENYIQINLAGLLKKELKEYNIYVESSTQGQADILVFRNQQMVAAIEIKVVRLGQRDKKNNDGVKIKSIVKDINKLRKQKNIERLLICVVYKHSKRLSNSWGRIGNDNGENYRNKILQELKIKEEGCPIPDVVKFCSNDGCIDIFNF